MAKVSSQIILWIPFFKSDQKKWKKLNLKKNIHFTNEEEIFVAKMIADGADYNKVLQWHLRRFGRPMHKSKFYAHRKRAQTLDLGIFSVLKLQYRKWLGSQKLNGVVVSEEMAVLRVVELFSNLSDKCINYAWKLSGIKKFQTLESEKPEDINNELLIDDLNERLEELHFFENEL